MVEEQTTTWITALETWVPLLIPLLSLLLLLPNRDIGKTRIRTNQQSRLTLADATASKVVLITRHPDVQPRRIKSSKNWQYLSIAIGSLIFFYCIALWVILPGLKDRTENVTPLIGVAVLLTLVTMSIVGITIWSLIALYKRQYSPTAKHTAITVDGSLYQIMMRCLVATLNTGADIINLDTQSGFIEAELERGRLNIRIQPVGEGARHMIEVHSDRYLPIVVGDGGRNAKNLSTFTQEYFKVRSQ